MRTVTFLRLACFFFLVGACTDNIEFVPTLDSTLDWNESLKTIVFDNNFTMSNNNLSIIEKRQIKNTNISDKYFFEKEYAFIPVYLLDNTRFTLKNIESVSKDTSIVSLQRLQKIRTIVDDIIDSSDSYNFVELTWKQNNDYFKSVSVFDRITGELIYDNVLYNILLASNYSGGFNIMIVSAEYENAEYEGSDFVSFSEDGTEYAWVSLNWYEHGHWDFIDGPIENGYFERTYFYRHDVLEHYFDQGVNPKNGVQQHYVTRNFTPTNGVYDYSGTNYYGFTYYMCAAKNSFSFTPSSYSPNTTFSDSECSFKVISYNDSPSRLSVRLPWYMHSSYYYY